MAGIDRWLVIGSRRWARVMTTELCALLPAGYSILLQASPSDSERSAWWNECPYKERLEIVDQPISCEGSATGVALVVNSAHEHQGSVEAALDAGYHVVCEKPLTFSRHDSLHLLARADRLGLKLFSTNTYLFADYLHVLKRDWLQRRTFSELQLTWADAAAEIRHGEAKSYDSGVPVIFDVLPHVASIVLATLGRLRFDRSSIAVAQGGRAVMAQFDGDALTLRASMARTSAHRTRLLRFSGPAGRVTLDFAAEPGLVSFDQRDGVCIDPAWASKRKPIRHMLESVQAYFEDGVVDDRLDAEAALLANDLIDGVAESYVQQQIDFLAAPRRIGESSRDEDLAYAVKEADAIRQRALPRLPRASPLRRLAMAGVSSRPKSNQPDKAAS